MKKRLFTVIVAIALILTAGVAFSACQSGDGNPSVYKVTYVYHDGSTPNRTVEVTKGEVATEPKDPEYDGYEFDYWYLTGETSSYDFLKPVASDITLNAHWTAITPETQNYKLQWTAFEGGQYVGKNNVALPSNAEENTLIKFAVDLSPYYTDTAVVKVNRKSVEIGADGFYSVTLTRDTTIEVSGVEEDKTPFEGSGTFQSPYLIKSAGQMRLLARNVNSGSVEYATAHYRLENDIDFKNYEYEVIGNSTATPFLGYFNGNGYKLANMSITDPFLEASFTSPVSYRTYLGVFGMVAVTNLSAYSATVDNLVVENFNVNVSESASVFAGGIIGYGVGASLWNCTVDGNMRVKTLDGYFSFTGGMMGINQSSMDKKAGIPYYGNIMYCATDVDIVTEGYSNAAGGICGYMLTDGGATAFVINSYARGNVSGAMYAGGIVGHLSGVSSVANCYSTGDVDARATIPNIEYAYAGAGGLVGYAENDSVIQNSFATGAFSAYSVMEVAGTGNQYAFASGLAGITLKSGAMKISSRQVSIVSCYYAENGMHGNLDFMTEDTLKNTLGWRDCDWKFSIDGTDYPTIQEESIPAANNLTLIYGSETVSGQTQKEIVVEEEGNVYLPVSYWKTRGVLPTDLTADVDSFGIAKRMYGYFFDEACTQPVPDAYIFAYSETLYAGWSNYGAVAGEFIFEADGKVGSILMTDAGVAYLKFGAITQTISYSYGYRYGEDTTPKITFYDAYFASAYVGNEAKSHTDFIATVENGVLSIVDALYFTAGDELRAFEDNALVGTWYNADKTYTFNVDRTCSFEGENGIYSIAGNDVTVKVGAATWTGTLADAAFTLTKNGETETLTLTEVDVLKGVWESEINHNYTLAYEFDGKGNYEVFTYYYENFKNGDKIAQRKVKGDSAQGTYQYSADVIKFDGTEGKVGRFDRDGLLNVTENGFTEIFGREDGFRGTWADGWINDGEGYTMTLTGIGVNGTGRMTDSNGYVATYELSQDGMMIMYVGTSLYCMGNYAANNLEGDPVSKKGGMLFCALYTASSGMLVDDYNLAHLDLFEGKWTTASETLGDISFNGLGDYDIRVNLSTGLWVVEGEVTVKGTKVRYYNKTANTAEFEYLGKKYTVTFVNGKLTLTGADVSVSYVRQDIFADYEWMDGEGGKYIFNGKGEIGKGVLTVIGADSVSDNYAYTVSGDTAAVTNQGLPYATARRNPETGFLEFTAAGGEKVNLGVQNEFSGEWAVEGGSKIRIGVLNEALRGEGVYTNASGAKNVTFRLATAYALAMDYVSQTDSSENFTLYILLLQNGELALSAYYQLVENNYLICTRPDAWMGTWTGDAGTLTFDGVGNSEYVFGRATLQLGAEEEKNYYYTKREGVWALYGLAGSDVIAQYILIEGGNLSDAEMTYTMGDRTVGLYISDGLFGLRVIAEDGVEYTFNGLSSYGKGSLAGGNQTYTYSDAVVNEDGTVTVRLTDSEDRCYTGTVSFETDLEGNPIAYLTMVLDQSVAA